MKPRQEAFLKQYSLPMTPIQLPFKNGIAMCLYLNQPPRKDFQANIIKNHSLIIMKNMSYLIKFDTIRIKTNFSCKVFVSVSVNVCHFENRKRAFKARA